MIAPILGAVWRIWDGAGWGKTTVRSIFLLGMILAIMGYNVSILTLREDWPLWLWAVAIVAAMQKGFVDWNNWRTNIYQYWYALVPFPLLLWKNYLTVETALIYVACLIVAGLSHPIVSGYNLHTRWAEGVAGALVVGGVSLI